MPNQTCNPGRLAIGLPIPPYPAAAGSVASGGAGGSSSTHTSRSKTSKKATQKKGRRMAWLLIHNTGETQTLNLDKRMLVQVLGLEIPMRDLRLMDPALAAFDSQFTQILVRDNALVVSAEHVRLIITCDKVIFPLDFEKSDASSRFMKAIEGIIRERPDCPAYSSAGAAAMAARAAAGDASGRASASPGHQPQQREQQQQHYGLELGIRNRLVNGFAVAGIWMPQACSCVHDKQRMSVCWLSTQQYGHQTPLLAVQVSQSLQKLLQKMTITDMTVI